ncbi:extensin [Peromyscus leucopus]|uniref:extensin n=1 Tax=Peromyscus leucopus TaxID=10041 RepID=UPI0010A1DBF7|nr:extensin [Peromyscus leucopus]
MGNSPSVPCPLRRPLPLPHYPIPLPQSINLFSLSDPPDASTTPSQCPIPLPHPTSPSALSPSTTPFPRLQHIAPPTATPAQHNPSTSGPLGHHSPNSLLPASPPTHCRPALFDSPRSRPIAPPTLLSPTPQHPLPQPLSPPSGSLRYHSFFPTSPPHPSALTSAASGELCASCASHFCPGESELLDQRFTVHTHRTLRPHPLYYETTPIIQNTRLLVPETTFLGQTVLRHTRFTPFLPIERKPNLCPPSAFLEVVARGDLVSRLFQETQPQTFMPWVELNDESWH